MSKKIYTSVTLGVCEVPESVIDYFKEQHPDSLYKINGVIVQPQACGDIIYLEGKINSEEAIKKAREIQKQWDKAEVVK